ncbi:MAG: alpha-N-arabinofuranosidase [Novosphingobium sp. 17-62-19]|uniref:alpha-N-arabinofuranosidase n=1 Tax=Novosphingobium sp. 17-62-19 TaxID=1970406 RepID=UPI000BDA7A72|nr:alpha-L-arabinofuranosidase C-terminal domain-containing protein [Novosphingobium sp. 17-62-19]OYX94543.1 MAG: alpha-N-arabinofuranosidase [Novosphingobium sp. 35-62-5]OZA21620.1 MAG: alpha-N-arabinofuranosidase [Novosphingobium sp. 17-62-19]HQS95868.1 alpha-L-arabinofuranosidase C-terminal domain-containing protein [Novosphingobium sp.]
MKAVAKTIRTALLAATTALIGIGTPALAKDAAVEVKIDAAQTGPVIDRHIFGQFAEHLGSGIYGGLWVGKDSPIPNVRGIRSDVVGALKALKVPNVRWPGGCFADEYHWRDGIGPADKRRVQINTNWGGVPESNAFGTHEFMDFAEMIGADAYISVNIGSGTAAEASAWIEYMTAETGATTLAKERAANGHPNPWKVPILGLGNENWGCGGAMSATHYVEEMKRFANFTRNFNPAQREGAARMKRIAVGWDSDKLDYTEEVMKAWKDHVYSWDIEGVSLHKYTTGGWPPHLPATGFGNEEYAIAIADTLTMDSLITRQSATMDKYDPEKKLMIAVDEWGAWLAPTPGSNPGFLQQQNSMRDGVLTALNVNIFARHADRVKIANIAQMINVLQAMILTDGSKMVLTPTYHVFRMYVPFQDAQTTPVTFDAGKYVNGKHTLPSVDAMAAKDKAGQVWVSLVNVDPEAGTSVTIPGFRTASGEVLTAPKADSVNTFAAPSVVSPKAIAGKASGKGVTITLPPHSVAVVKVSN